MIKFEPSVWGTPFVNLVGLGFGILGSGFALRRLGVEVCKQNPEAQPRLGMRLPPSPFPSLLGFEDPGLGFAVYGPGSMIQCLGFGVFGSAGCFESRKNSKTITHQKAFNYTLPFATKVIKFEPSVWGTPFANLAGLGFGILGSGFALRGLGSEIARRVLSVLHAENFKQLTAGDWASHSRNQNHARRATVPETWLRDGGARPQLARRKFQAAHGR